MPGDSVQGQNEPRAVTARSEMMVTEILWLLVLGVADARLVPPTDKITVIGSGVLGKVKNPEGGIWRQEAFII